MLLFTHQPIAVTRSRLQSAPVSNLHASMTVVNEAGPPKALAIVVTLGRRTPSIVANTL